MAPQLRIPVTVNLDQYKEGMERMSTFTRMGIRRAAVEFAALNGGIAGVAARADAMGKSIGTALTSSAAPAFALQLGAVAAAALAVGAALSATRGQLQEILDVAKKAENLGVSPQFYQGFISEADNLKLSVTELDAALKHAFDATKGKPPIDLSEWSFGKEKIDEVEKALRVYNLELAKPAGKPLQGLLDYRNATTPEEKYLAALKAAKELETMGQKLASIDIGERLLGKGFADKLRTGQTSIDGMTKSIMNAQGNRLFSDSVVKETKEIDERLEKAQNRLSRELKPTWESLVTTVNMIKNNWARIVELIGEAVALTNRIELSQKKSELVETEAALKNGTGMAGLPRVPIPQSAYDAVGINSPEQNLTARAARLKKDIEELEAMLRPRIRVEGTGGKGYGGDPTKTGDDDKGRDRLDTAADTIEKRTAKVLAEVSAINLGTEAREKAKIAAELETVAKQMNAEAGKENSAITDEQRKRIDEVSAAYGRAQKAIENARSPLATFARESANIDAALNKFAASTLDGLTNGLTDLIMGTKTAAQAFKALATSIIQDLIRIAIRAQITGPIASALGAATGSVTPWGASAPAGGGSGFSGFQARAEGGPVRKGQPYIVGERRAELFVPDQNGVIVPRVPNIPAVRSGGGGGFGASGGGDSIVNVYNNAEGATARTERRPDGSIDVYVDMLDGALAKRKLSGRGPSAKADAAVRSNARYRG